MEAAVKANFGLELTKRFGHKHFFGHARFRKALGASLGSPDSTLFIGIVRHPVDWLNSFWRKPHHLKSKNKHSKAAFLDTPIRSFDFSTPGKPEIKEDRHMKTGKPYRHIFQLRKVKARFLLKQMPKLAKHYILIRYEDLKDHYDATLRRIANTFGPFGVKPTAAKFKPIVYYKGKKKQGKFKPNKAQKTAFTARKVRGRLCLGLERRLGYRL